MLSGYVSTAIRNRLCLLLQRGDRLESSESGVYRRQILTSKVDPRTVRINKQNINYRG